MVGLSEFLVILFVVLLVIGGKRLPQIASAIGNSVHAFRKALKGGTDSISSNDSSGFGSRPEKQDGLELQSGKERRGNSRV